MRYIDLKLSVKNIRSIGLNGKIGVKWLISGLFMRFCVEPCAWA